jgi:hypothetical protein
LSAADLIALQRANAHFSDDLLSSLLNEPIPGQGVFWSSVGGKPYPVSLRALSFEHLYAMRDPGYNRSPGHTYAQTLRGIFSGIGPSSTMTHVPEAEGALFAPEAAESALIDVMATIEQRAIEALRNNSEIRQKIESPNGMPWYGVQKFLMDHLPEHLEDRHQFAYKPGLEGDERHLRTQTRGMGDVQESGYGENVDQGEPVTDIRPGHIAGGDIKVWDMFSRL